MSRLAEVKKGKIQQPILTLIYGPDGVGKSTFGADAPNPIFVGTEKGTANLDVARYPSVNTFKDVMFAIEDLTKNPHSFQTLVIDSLDWLEPLVWEQVCFDHNLKSVEDLGYGKGYVYAQKLWDDMIKGLSAIRESRKMNIVLIAHAHIKLTKDPQVQAEYDRYELKLNKTAASRWREFVDSVLFANYEVHTKSDKQGKTKAFGDGARYLFTERRPGFDAKNRFGLPFQLPLSWADFAAACDTGPTNDPKVLLENVHELINYVTDPALKEKVMNALERVQSDPVGLGKLQEKLRALVAA